MLQSSSTMRSTIRLLAAVERSSRFLEVGAPTGLTGLPTHGSPRSTLLYLYNTTLEKLKEFPEYSVYRQSTEALTKHRMKTIEEIKPEGLEQWQQRVQTVMEQHPKAVRKIPTLSGSDFNIIWKQRVTEKTRFNAEGEDGPARNSALPSMPEGATWSEEDVEKIERQLKYAEAVAEAVTVEIEPEPALTREQIGDIESKLQAGLIEEIIQVAEAEKQLADVMLNDKVLVNGDDCSSIMLTDELQMGRP